jgi:hypothetical protein
MGNEVGEFDMKKYLIKTDTFNVLSIRLGVKI